MIGLVKKIVKKLKSICQRIMGMLKHFIRKVAGFLFRKVSNYPRLSSFAIRVLNKFPRLKALVRRITQSSAMIIVPADMPLTSQAQQLEDDLLYAIAQKKGR